MQYRKLGKSDLNISEITLGCWVMGGDYWGGTEDDDSIKAIRTALNEGINFFDTAELYGKGHSEKVLGKALKERRKEVCISTKVWTNHMKKDQVIQACEDSLKRLETDYIDVYFIHYPVEDVPIEETMESMLRLKEQGKIRVIGLSNFSLSQMEEVLKIGRIDVIQPCYSMLWRYIDEDIIPFCIENQIGIIPYSPLAQGILTGKFNKDSQFKEGDGRKRAPLFQPQWFGKALTVADGLRSYAEKYNRTQAQVAINWTNYRPGITSAIVGARNEKQARENAGAVGWQLCQEDWDKLNELSLSFTQNLPKFQSFFRNNVIE
jgi:myo-inositol catabolism protein IolS